MTYIILIIVAVIGFFIGRKTVKKFTRKDVAELDKIREGAKKALDERTEERKERILDFIKNEVAHQKELEDCNTSNTNPTDNDGQKKGITRADVEKLLDVSGGTARKYLNELEDEDKIKQNGASGKGVYYTLKT